MNRKYIFSILLFAVVSITVLSLSRLNEQSGLHANEMSCPKWNGFEAWSGGGAYPQVLAEGDDIYLVSDVAGIWKAGKDESNWRHITNGLDILRVAALLAHPNDASHFYAATSKGIYQTLDAGANWSLLDSLGAGVKFWRWNSVRPMAIHPADDSKIFAGDARGNVYLIDNEESIVIGTSPRAKAVTVVVPLDMGNKLLVGTAESTTIFIRNDQGWRVESSLTENAYDADWDRNLLAPANMVIAGERRLKLTRDGGDSWQTISLDNALPSGAIVHRVSMFNEQSGNTKFLVAWFAGWRSGILQSNDAGVNWNDPVQKRNFDSSNPTRTWKKGSFDRVMSVHIDPSDSGTAYLSTYWGYWRSQDDGKTWTENFINGAPNTAGSSLIYTDNGELITASMDIGLVSYAPNRSALSLFPKAGRSYIKNSFIDTWDIAGHAWSVVSHGQKIVASISPWSANQNQVVISEDFGASWEVVTSGLPLEYVKEGTVWEKGYARALVKDPYNPEKLYLAIDGAGLFVSENGGYQWSESSAQPDSVKIYNGLVADPNHQGYLYWGAPGVGVYVTKDAGRSWIFTGLRGKAIYDLEMNTDGRLFAATQGAKPELFVKDGLGKQWRLLKSFDAYGTAEAIAISPNDPNTIAIGTNGWGNENKGQVFISRDGGIQWTELEGDFGVGAADMAFSPCSDTLSVLQYAGGVVHLSIAE
ncbi:sialidase family protein [Corallincola spongiicola]|uniref:Photosynthesis system II assembly factor Ycf48/Hcf136-like domain-containing protein n=1 Tax=Corallincola spongiicola TaxID=2520508 RepID=A0ABY1WSN5_9GAMM|nr:hypothetical protein [Corallincola spongiicola]TAA47759.1 hypothetical protein EXY25_00470 [Corallincola spongiicola]